MFVDFLHLPDPNHSFHTLYGWNVVFSPFAILCALPAFNSKIDYFLLFPFHHFCCLTFQWVQRKPKRQNNKKYFYSQRVDALNAHFYFCTWIPQRIWILHSQTTPPHLNMQTNNDSLLQWTIRLASRVAEGPDRRKKCANKTNAQK